MNAKRRDSGNKPTGGLHRGSRDIIKENNERVKPTWDPVANDRPTPKPPGSGSNGGKKTR